MGGGLLSLVFLSGRIVWVRLFCGLGDVGFAERTFVPDTAQIVTP